MTDPDNTRQLLRERIPSPRAVRGGIIDALAVTDTPTHKPLTGAAKKAHRRTVLIETAQEAMGTRGPDAIVALLVEAEQARPTKNPKPLRPEVRDAVLADQDQFRSIIASIRDADLLGFNSSMTIAEAQRISDAGGLAEMDDDASHAAECARYDDAIDRQGDDALWVTDGWPVIRR